MRKFAMIMQQKLKACYNFVKTELTARYQDCDVILVFNDEKYTISCCKKEYDYVQPFVDGMITMFNYTEGYSWISMDEEWVEDVVFISIELN